MRFQTRYQKACATRLCAARGLRRAACGARRAAHELRCAVRGARIAVRRFRSADRGPRLAAHGLPRAACWASCSALGSGGGFKLWLAAPLAVPRGRWAGGGSHTTMMRGSHNAGFEPPGGAGPARPSSPGGGGQARPPAAVACPPLSCPRDPAAPLPPPPCICTLQVYSNRRTADGRPSPRTARLWERREREEGKRVRPGSAVGRRRERGCLPVE